MSNIQTGAERMPHDLSQLGFLAGQSGRLITISTTPAIAGDSFEMDAVGALRLSPLRRGLAIDSTVDIFTLILKSGVNHTSRGSISTSTLPSIKLRKCSSKIITSILSFISGRLATKSNQIKQLIRNGRSASLQRTFKKSFTSFSHS